MSADKPKEAEPDYKNLWRNFSTYRKDATARYEKQAGIARAKMAQAGIKEGSDAWNTRMGEVEAQYKQDMREIRKGYTGNTLKKHLKKQMRWGLMGGLAGDLRKSREFAKLSPEELQGRIEGVQASIDQYNKLDHEDQHKMGAFASNQRNKRELGALKMAQRGTEYMDAYEKYTSSGGKDWMPLADQIFGERYGEGKQTFGKMTKEEEAMERAKTAAGGQTTDAGMGQSAAMMAEQENKFKTVNPWI